MKQLSDIQPSITNNKHSIIPQMGYEEGRMYAYLISTFNRQQQTIAAITKEVQHSFKQNMYEHVKQENIFKGT